MNYLKQSNAATVIIGPFVDDTDGKTPEQGLTITQADVKLSKHDGTVETVNDANAASHVYMGHYIKRLDITDTDTLGRMRVMVKESGALSVWDDFEILPPMMYDSIIAGTDRLDVNVTHVVDMAQTVVNNEASFAAISTDVGYNAASIVANMASIVAVGLQLPVALTGAGNIKADVVAISNSASAADRLENSAGVIEVSTAKAGTLSTTQMTTNLTEATNNHYNGRIIIWTSGALIRQATDITDYVGATKKLIFTAVTEAPVAGDGFVIV